VKSSIDSDIEYIKKEYESCKAKGLELLDKGKIDAGLKYLEFAGKIAWKFPILEAFCDDDLEFKIDQFCLENLKKINFKGNPKRIVFYNGQLIDRGGLTQQYLNYFIKLDFEVLIIVPHAENIQRGNSILSQIRNSQKLKIFIPESKETVSKIVEIREQIEGFQPNFSFLHFLPNDIIGFASFSHLSGTIKYLIVHNDHSFWIGKKCSDYFIEYRKFGCFLSCHFRGIPKSKIILNPFYPITTGEDFKGFPFNPSGKIIGISGANLYKYLQDPNFKFFANIKKLIENHPTFIFCLCGAGNTTKIIQFIRDNKLSNQFFILGNRDDFYNLVGKCDIMFESYPLKGGLTPLFAIEQKVPVLGVYDNLGVSGSLEDLLQISNYKQPTSFYKFQKEAKNLIESSEARKKLSLIQSKTPLTKTNFDKNMNTILFDTTNSTLPEIEIHNFNPKQDLNNIIRELDDVKSFIKISRIENIRNFMPPFQVVHSTMYLLFLSKIKLRSRIGILKKIALKQR
jgi:hypothetical protein